MIENVIDVRNISKTYKGFDIDRKETGVGLWIKNIFKLTSNKSQTIHALKNVSFNVRNGEIFGIFGANGAGKTTLVKILSGLLYPSDGSVTINGLDGINNIKNNISYISTNGWMGLEWQLTAKENLILYGNMFGMSGKALNKKCDDVLKQLDMFTAKDKYISQLSAGMRQKITIARGLIIDKPIIYLDEPTVSLDVNSSISLRNIIQEYVNDNNRTAIITSHNPEDLYICDRIMFIYKGEIIAMGPIDELKKPLENIQTVVIKCPHFDSQKLARIHSIHGVVNILAESIEGKKDYQSIKVNIRKDEATAGDIIDFFIDCSISILGMNTKEASLQEIYEYYVGGVSNG